MKTVEEIAKEAEKLEALDQAGTLPVLGAVGVAYARQALAWVLRDNVMPPSETLIEASKAGL